jgi:hypothetical protein
MKTAVFAIVPNAAQAETIVDELRVSGFLNTDVSVLFPDVARELRIRRINSIGAPGVNRHHL